MEEYGSGACAKKRRYSIIRLRFAILDPQPDNDRVIDNDAASRLFMAAAQPKVVLSVDAGHAIPVDYGWEKLVPVIAAFARDGRLPER